MHELDGRTIMAICVDGLVTTHDTIILCLDIYRFRLKGWNSGETAEPEEIEMMGEGEARAAAEVAAEAAEVRRVRNDLLRGGPLGWLDFGEPFGESMRVLRV